MAVAGLTAAAWGWAAASAEAVVGTIAGLLGLAPKGREMRASSLVPGFSLASIAAAPAEITVRG